MSPLWFWPTLAPLATHNKHACVGAQLSGPMIPEGWDEDVIDIDDEAPSFPTDDDEQSFDLLSAPPSADDGEEDESTTFPSLPVPLPLSPAPPRAPPLGRNPFQQQSASDSHSSSLSAAAAAAASSSSSSNRGTPSSPSSSPAVRPSSDPYAKRRAYELSLVTKHDAIALSDPRKECWYLVNSDWITSWAAFVTNDPTVDGLRPSQIVYGPSRSRQVVGASESGTPPSLQSPPPPSTSVLPPGPISNNVLFTGGGTKVRADISPIRDYRGVSPVVWFLYVEQYGTDGSPPIPRYAVDHRGEPVFGERLLEAVRGAEMKAKVEVRRMREELMGHRGGLVKPKLPKREEDKVCWCFTSDLLEKFLFMLFTCCYLLGSANKKKDDGIGKYRKVGDDGDDLEGHGTEMIEFDDDEDEEEDMNPDMSRV